MGIPLNRIGMPNSWRVPSFDSDVARMVTDPASIDVIVASKLGGDGCPEGGFTAIVGIARAPAADGLLRRCRNVIRCGEVRFAAHERHDVAPLCLQLAHLAKDRVDGGGFQMCRSGGERNHGGVTSQE